MAHDKRISSQRRKILDQARDLARSGEHANHKSIVEVLRKEEGFEFAEKRLQQYALAAQLDRMCRMAWDAHASKQEGEAQAY